MKFSNDETKVVYNFIKKNMEKFCCISSSLELEMRVRAYNSEIGLEEEDSDGESDEGIEWVCFDELFKIYDNMKIDDRRLLQCEQPDYLRVNELKEWKERMKKLGCVIEKYDVRDNSFVFRPIRAIETKQRGFQIVDRVVERYGSMKYSAIMYIAKIKLNPEKYNITKHLETSSVPMRYC